MTTFSYRFDLNDSERLALERALQIAIAHCDEQMKDGPKSPHWSIKHGCEAILEKLHSAEATQMSGYYPPMEPTPKRRNPK